MATLLDEIRNLLVSSLRLPRDPQSIQPNTPLFGKELGLDSVDAVQLVSAIEKHFQVEISDYELAQFSYATLASLVEMLREKGISEKSAAT